MTDGGVSPGAAQPEARRWGPAEWFRSAPWEWIGPAGLAVSVLVFLWELPAMLDNNPDFLGVVVGQLWVFLWLGVLSFFTRTVTVRTVAIYYLTGFFGVTAMVRLLSWPFVAVFGTDSVVVYGFSVPIFEEVGKLAPLLLFVIVGSRNRMRQPSVLDLGLLGLAVGCGFELYETSVALRGSFPGVFELSHPLTWVFPIVTPQFDWVVVIAHPGWGLVLGIGLGLAWQWRRSPATWLLALGALMLTTLDHLSINNAPAQLDLLELWTLTLRGWLVVAAMVAGIAAGLVVDWRLTAEGDRLDPWFSRPGGDDVRRALGESDPFTVVARLLAMVTYLRALNGAHLLVRHAVRRGRLDRVSPGLPRLLAVHRARAGIPRTAADRTVIGVGGPAPTGRGPAADGAATAGHTTDHGAGAPPAAWHPDPHGRHEHRWWDGVRWTEHVADGGLAGVDPVDDEPPEPTGEAF
ncbi:MAG: DUF2510 domain-containing protein [Acidimicrobiia bacterium]|nr:DUF2510 domain-containing protein [Acidimicrobiia bacterium]